MENGFFRLICGDMVKKQAGTRHFLKAAETLHVSPKNCLALRIPPTESEQLTPRGIRSVMVPDLIEPTADLRAMADAVCESLYDVIPYLEKDRKGELPNG